MNKDSELEGHEDFADRALSATGDNHGHTRCAKSGVVSALSERVAVIGHRVTAVEQGILTDREVREREKEEFQVLLQSIRDKNHIKDFVAQYWQWLVVLYLISTREDVEGVVRVISTIPGMIK